MITGLRHNSHWGDWPYLQRLLQQQPFSKFPAAGMMAVTPSMMPFTPPAAGFHQCTTLSTPVPAPTSSCSWMISCNCQSRSWHCVISSQIEVYVPYGLGELNGCVLSYQHSHRIGGLTQTHTHISSTTSSGPICGPQLLSTFWLTDFQKISRFLST